MDPLTGRYVCGTVSGMNTNGKYCKDTIDKCTCSTCKDGLATISNGVCNQLGDATLGWKALIPGCLKHKSDTVCETCEDGYIKTTETDSKCYQLVGVGASRSSNGYYTTSETNYDKVPEPCKTALNVNECTECDSNFDAGLVNIAAGKGAAANV